MAVKHYDVTLLATATQLSSAADQLQQIIVQNTAGNSAIYIGGSTVTDSSYGYTVAAGAAVIIGAGTQGAPIVANGVWFFGAENDVIHILAIS